MKIPVIINNRDLYSWPKRMLEKIKNLKSVGDIIIIDNESTYEPLLDWYETKPCEVIKVKNLGHTSPWLSGVVDKLNVPYVVTDSDLDIDNIPLDTLEYLDFILSIFSDKGKIGLAMDWERVTPNLEYYSHMRNLYYPVYTGEPIFPNVYNFSIDTTFALYNRKEYFIGGYSVYGDYKAGHLPWYLSKQDRENNEEFKYYLNMSDNSCSYKKFIKENAI
jgi:hypothetical protein